MEVVSRSGRERRGIRGRTEGGTVQVLGIDIGGSGIKAAPVDTAKGTLLTERVKVETPRPARPRSAVAAIVAQHVKNFDWTWGWWASPFRAWWWTGSP